jgi:ATP-dependent Lon protease
VLGLTALAVGELPNDLVTARLSSAARTIGRRILAPAEDRARQQERRKHEEAKAAVVEEPFFDPMVGLDEVHPEGAPVPEGHVVVCREINTKGASKGKNIAQGYDPVIGAALPLAPTPDVGRLRKTLLARFPHAEGVIDHICHEVESHPWVRFRPILIDGPPGGGKTRLVRAIAEALSVGLYRVDATSDLGGGFGGLERRWYSSEPCVPLMAVARYRIANPIVLVDELDKASTRTDYGRIWSALLPFLEPEQASRYPDPCFQSDLDLSHVTIIGTANETWRLPSPLLDRLQTVTLPLPSAEHMNALVLSILADLAAERGLLPQWLEPLDGLEHAALRRRWRGGSLRKLRRLVEGVLRVRDRRSTSH